MKVFTHVLGSAIKATRTINTGLGLHKVRAIINISCLSDPCPVLRSICLLHFICFFGALPISLTLLYRRPNHNRSLPFRNCLIKGKLLGLKSRMLSSRERRITFQFVFRMTNGKQRIDPTDLVDEILLTHCNPNVSAQIIHNWSYHYLSHFTGLKCYKAWNGLISKS